jgi:chaperone modulatory protein CbpM
MTMISETELFALVEGLTSGELEICVSAGWVVPGAARSGVRQFLEIDVARLKLIRELRLDLALGDEAVPVVLKLLDQIHALRYQLHCLSDALATQPEDVRRAIRAAIEARLAQER